MSLPSFSIVVPTYERREVVSAAVEAIGRLHYQGSMELIVVCDGSTDGTAELLRQTDCPIPLRIIEQANEGAASARNRGAAEATNDVLLFLDDDMICLPDLVEQHAEIYRQGADAVIGRTPIDQASADGFLSESTARWIAAEQVKSPLTPWDIFSGQLSVRRSVFKDIGGFDESFTRNGSFSNEDADLGVRLLQRFDVRYNPDAVTRQRYVVTPREYMSRAAMAAVGDLRFLAKNPAYTDELFNARGRASRLGRYIYLPLSGMPLLPRMLAGMALWTAEAAMKTRFSSSRLVARFFSGARAIAFWAAMRERCQLPGSAKLLALCYHAIQDQSDDPVLEPYGISPEKFIDHLNHFQSIGANFISAQQLADFLRYGAPLPRKAVLLTFDDCYPDLLEVARTILQPRGIPALAFAVTGMKTGTNEWDQAYGSGRIQLLNPQQLKELESLGIEVGSHSRTHNDMCLMDNGGRQSETRGSAEDLLRIGLRSPRYFAYPYGAEDEVCAEAVRDAGYIAAFGLGRGVIRDRSDRFRLERLVMMSSDRPAKFSQRLRAEAFQRNHLAIRKWLRARIVPKREIHAPE